MRLVRYEPETTGGARLGLQVGDAVYDLEARSPQPLVSGDMRALLGLSVEDRQAIAKAAQAGDPVRVARLLCPLPNPGKFLAQAANYTHSAAAPIPEIAVPWLFCKRLDDIAGPDDPIVLWDFAPDVVDEIEIALVIGKGGRNIPVEQALDHIAGYTICNDVSGRRLDVPKERRKPALDGFIDWLNGKWLDGYGILGPAIVTPDEMPALDKIEIIGRVNGEVRVQGVSRDIVHDFATAISYASRFMNLQPGDVIATGMPHGPGPEIYLKPGDVVEGEVTGLGVLRNPVVAEAKA